MAAKETNAERKQELLDIAEVCEHVPEHPARNVREAMQAHFFGHICAELEQVGCGYSEAEFGQNMEPNIRPTRPPAWSVPKRRLTCWSIFSSNLTRSTTTTDRASAKRIPLTWAEHHPRRLHRE